MKTLEYFKALSDITRLRLLNILIHYELSVNEIVSLMEMGQSRISRHLKILMEAGFLECRRDGAWAFYFISHQGQGRELINAIRYLLDKEPFFDEDLLRAEHIVQDRSLKTMQFFNQIAFKWDLLKRKILGDFDLNFRPFMVVGFGIQALFFAFIHQNYYNNIRMMWALFIGGFAFAVFYSMWDDLTANILGHFILNLFTAIQSGLFILQF